MNMIRPFIVEREFGIGAAGASPAFEAELQRVQKEVAREVGEARAEAEAAALERLRSERDTALLAACDALQASLELLDERFAETERQMIADAAELAQDAADLIAGAALQRTPTRAVEAALERALHELRRGSPLTLRVHSDLLEPLEAALAARQQRDRRRLNVTILADDELAAGDARLSWDHGEARLEREVRRATLARELAELLNH